MTRANLFMKKRYILLSMVLFLFVLSGFRILWVQVLHTPSQMTVENGKLSLQDWHAGEEDILLLDGEWEFSPSQLLITDEKETHNNEDQWQLIEVPSKWDEALEEGRTTPYGYGSYRLRIYVNPDEQINYSIYVPSVRSSSEVYVNGRFLAGSGQVGKTEEAYIAKNLPYSTTFTADENGLIDIVIQAANFKDVRRSGIIRSIKFGSEQAIAKEQNMSLLMQTVASVIFLIHSIYALVLYFLGNREKRLLYFSLLLFCITLMNLMSNDEKIFHLLFYIGYDWDFRLANVILPIATYALLKTVDHRKIPYWRIINPIYSVSAIGLAVVTLFSSASQIIMLFPIYYLLVGLTIVLVLIPIVKKIYKNISGNVLLLFSMAAIIHHFVWIIYWRETGISVAHYPFDLIVSVVCFASIWFKDYFKMHAETRELAKKLQKMNEHKDQFLANTSHEFKNPLHGMLNMSQTVLGRERHLLGKKSIHELETILTVGRRLSLLLNDLLDVASLREGNPRLEQKNIKIQSILTGVTDMLQFIVDVKPVKIVNQVSDDFPTVVGDENRVIQILYNLLHNAVKFTDEGDIYIRAKVKGERAFITVSDTGIGMTDDFIKRSFQPYVQAVGEEIVEGGLGLGLSISKQLIELHGGQLEVASTLGEGSEFTFSLKLASIEKYKENPESDSLANVQNSSLEEMMTNHLLASSFDWSDDKFAASIEQPTLMETNTEWVPILIVDDDPINLQVLQSILSSEPYEITTALSGQEALDKLEEKNWNLVITDIMMPHMSGYELTRMIRKRYSFTELPVLLLTARSNPEDIQAGFRAGANDYVTKPVEMLELRSRVRALTIIKRAVREQLQLEAAWLQAQIQPHFLFNTLNSIIALSEIDLEKMHALLIELSGFLRSKYQFQHIDELIPIEDELKLVRSYLNIEKVRFGDRIQIVWKTEINKRFKIPFLTIQPLVENAIRHGIMKRVDGGEIVIQVSIHENQAEISVADDGVGMTETQLQSLLERKQGSRTHIGLINTNQRLIRQFGTGLKIKSKPDAGTVVSFVVSI